MSSFLLLEFLGVGCVESEEKESSSKALFGVKTEGGSYKAVER